MEPIVYGTPKCRYFHQTGAPYDSKPHLPLAPLAGTLPWKWFPWKIRISTPSLLRWLGGTLLIASLPCLRLIATGQAAAGVILFLTLQLLAWSMFYLAYIMCWNFRLREAICWCFGKSVQAKEQWRKCVDAGSAKEVFFTYNISHSVFINVLKDGTQELWNKSGGEFAAGLNEAFGQAGFEGKIFDMGGAVSDSIADSAVASPGTSGSRLPPQNGITESAGYGPERV